MSRLFTYLERNLGAFGVAAYYNENDQRSAAWLKELIKDGLIAAGEVDDRSIRDVSAADLRGFDQCHFFAGIGGWSAALRLAGWKDDRPVWTGSCPCQPFSAVGQRKGFDDKRHLWPVWHELIRQRRPAIIFGEQSAQATDWLGLVRGDLDTLEYAVGAVPIEAASAGADTLGDRFWFVAASNLAELRWKPSTRQQPEPEQNTRACPDDARGQDNWRRGSDGKKRRVNPGIDWMAHGVRHRMGKIRGYGNAIDPRLGAAFIEAACSQAA